MRRFAATLRGRVAGMPASRRRWTFFVPPATQIGHWCVLALQVESILPTCDVLCLHLRRKSGTGVFWRCRWKEFCRPATFCASTCDANRAPVCSGVAGGKHFADLRRFVPPPATVNWLETLCIHNIRQRQRHCGGRKTRPGGLSTPGRGQGEGPAGDKSRAKQGTQETVGGAGVSNGSEGREAP